MPVRCLIDGQPQERIPVDDRGLAYGDSLFETLAVVGGLPCRWRAHLDRLAEGLTRLAFPPIDFDLLRTEARQLIDAPVGVLKIQITRGSGGRGYRPDPQAVARRILRFSPGFPHSANWREQGIAVRFCRTRWGDNPQLAGIKHGNRLEQILARDEWDDPTIAEGLMLDQHGRCVSGTMSNLFLLRDGVLYTPPVEHSGVAGTVRALVLHCAEQLGQPCRVQAITQEGLAGADAIFLTNSLIGYWPVRRLGEQQWSSTNWPRELFGLLLKRVFEP